MSDKKQDLTDEDDLHTPDFRYLRGVYRDRRAIECQAGNIPVPSDDELDEELDRWLQAVQAKAWLEGYREARRAFGHVRTKKPYTL